MTAILFAKSDFSLGLSILSPEAIASAAKEHGYKYAALSDLCTLSGAIRFSQACTKAGIKPLIGSTVRIYDDLAEREKKSKQIEYRFDLYIKNAEGFRDLCELLSLSNQADHFYYFPRVNLDEVIAAVSRGNLVVVCSDTKSVYHRRDHMDILKRVWETGASVYSRTQLVDTPVFERVKTLAKSAMPHAILPGLTALYGPDDADILDIHNTVVTNSKAAYAKHPWQRNQFPVPPAHIEASLVNQEVVALEMFAESISWSWKDLPISLPKMAEDEFAELTRMSIEGFRKRLLKPVLGYKPTDLQVYKERLAYELQVLRDLKFSGYFLLVSQIVNWSRDAGIITGPGRGSVGGSLVAFLIGMTDVDPIRFNLIFERFINPERLDLPDADLDFMSSRRDDVVTYIEKTWGQDYVAGLSNYGYMRGSSAIRDVGRVMELPHFDYECSKLVPKEHGIPVSLKVAVKQVAAIEVFSNKHPAAWKFACKLEDVMRSLGRHAAGVVVAGEPLVTRAVVERREEKRTINWDKRVSEMAGLVKLDVLGLSTLDVLRICVDRIAKRTGEVIDLLDIPMDDAATLRAFGAGETTGVFQFESPGMRKLLKDLALSGELTFDDLSAATALYRPGPMDSGLLQDYVNYRQGLTAARYDHPNMKPALHPTGGVIVYQEQVMQIARDLCGFTFAEADKLRKAMGKKDAAMMADQRSKFVKGAEATSGMKDRPANDLFDKIEKFAGYAFNKSHSVAYTIISFWTEYLKTRYPVDFYASNLSVADDEDKRRAMVKDAERDGVVIMPPDINISSVQWEATEGEGGKIMLYAPFNAVKGISDKGAEAIMTVRAEMGGFVESEAAMSKQVSKMKLARYVTSRSFENLRKVGAFCSVDPADLPIWDRARLADQIELMPGVVSKTVKATRTIESGKLVKVGITGIINEFSACDLCNLRDKVHVVPALGSSPKFMVVYDCPPASDEKSGKMLGGGAGQHFKELLVEAGLSAQDGYYTSLVKAVKEDKLSNDQINSCSKWLQKEVEILKPPVIITMGKAAQQYFASEVDGPWDAIAGTTVYRREHDCTIVIGFNPGMLYHDPSRKALMMEVLAKVHEMVRK